MAPPQGAFFITPDEIYKQKRKSFLTSFCGERGIRTPGGVTLNGFQDRRNRPLCHLSSVNAFALTGAKLLQLFILCKFFANFFTLNRRLLCLHRPVVCARRDSCALR